MVRHTSDVPTVDRVWSRNLKGEPHNKTVANKWNQRGNLLNLFVPVAPTAVVIYAMLYGLDTAKSMCFFPPVYIWRYHTPVLDLAIIKWFVEHARNNNVRSPMCFTWCIVRCSSQLRWAVVILRGSPGLWSHTILVVKLCFPKSHAKTFSSQIPKLHKSKLSKPKNVKHALLRIYVDVTLIDGRFKGGDKRLLQ